MPTKFPDNPIAQVRLAAKKTGEQFAASLFLSVGAIRNMESGKLVPSEETRERMFIAFGVNPDSLAQVIGTALSARGGPYTADSYIEWKRLTTIDDEGAEKMIEIEVERVRWFLQAAALNQSLFTTRFLLDTALERMATEGGFERLIEMVIRQQGRKDPWFRIDSGTVGVVDFVLKQLPQDAPQQ